MNEITSMIYFWVNLLVFVSYVVYALFVLIKLRMKLDRVIIVTIGFVFISFAIRLGNMITNVMTKSQRLVNVYVITNSFATFIFLVISYYFVFEMKICHDKLVSFSYEDFVRREKRAIKIRNIFLIIISICFIVTTAVLCDLYFVEDERKPITSPEVIIYYISKVIRLIADIYIFVVVVKYFSYIVKHKYKMLKKEGRSFNKVNRMVIGWISLVILIGLLDGLLICVIGILETIIDPEISDTLNDIARFVVYPVRDFLTILTILGIYYYQGMTEQRIN